MHYEAHALYLKSQLSGNTWKSLKVSIKNGDFQTRLKVAPADGETMKTA